jgi:site-specific recombinase XerD
MTNAMRLRGFAVRTQEAYCAAVAALARHYHCSPDRLSAEQLQGYLLYLITEKKQAYASVNQASCAFRFLYGTVLRWPEVRLDIPMAKVPKRLPQILSREEVARVIQAGASLRARTLLATTYAAGLRVTEVCALQLTDIESASDRMCLKVRQGKGGQDRYTLLSPRLLHTLRHYWADRRPRVWLFPNASGSAPIDVSTARAACTAPPVTRRASRAKAASIRCATPSPRICWKRAWICPPSSDCSVMATLAPPCVTCTWRALG